MTVPAAPRTGRVKPRRRGQRRKAGMLALREEGPGRRRG